MADDRNSPTSGRKQARLSAQDAQGGQDTQETGSAPGQSASGAPRHRLPGGSNMPGRGAGNEQTKDYTSQGDNPPEGRSDGECGCSGDEDSHEQMSEADQDRDENDKGERSRTEE